MIGLKLSLLMKWLPDISVPRLMNHLSAYDSIVYLHLKFTLQPIEHADMPDSGVGGRIADPKEYRSADPPGCNP
jgi:hypothetical protein